MPLRVMQEGCTPVFREEILYVLHGAVLIFVLIILYLVQDWVKTQ